MISYTAVQKEVIPEFEHNNYIDDIDGSTSSDEYHTCDEGHKDSDSGSDESDDDLEFPLPRRRYDISEWDQTDAEREYVNSWVDQIMKALGHDADDQSNPEPSLPPSPSLSLPASAELSDSEPSNTVNVLSTENATVTITREDPDTTVVSVNVNLAVAQDIQSSDQIKLEVNFL